VHTERVDPESELLGDQPVRLPKQDPPPPAVGPTRARSRLRPWSWLLSIVLVAGVAGVAVDARSRSHEGVAVAQCEQRLQLATWYAERRLGLVANYLEPAVDGRGRVQQLHLADLMSARAGKVLPRVQEADRTCRRVSVRPWHFALVKRQSTSTAYSAALVTLMQTLAAQGSVPFREDATMQRLRDAVGIDGD
jgi:hypothetical protein